MTRVSCQRVKSSSCLERFTTDSVGLRHLTEIGDDDMHFVADQTHVQSFELKPALNVEAGVVFESSEASVQNITFGLNEELESNFHLKVEEVQVQTNFFGDEKTAAAAAVSSPLEKALLRKCDTLLACHGSISTASSTKESAAERKILTLKFQDMDNTTLRSKNDTLQITAATKFDTNDNAYEGRSHTHTPTHTYTTHIPSSHTPHAPHRPGVQ